MTRIWYFNVTSPLGFQAICYASMDDWYGGCETIYTNKFKYLGKMDKLLGKCHLPKEIQEKIEYLKVLYLLDNLN